MATRLPMDDWPIDLVKEFESHSKVPMKIDCIFRVYEMDDEDQPPTYAIHAVGGKHGCGLDFVRLYDEGLAFVPEDAYPDSLFDLFSFAAHHPEMLHVGLEFRDAE